MGCIAKQVVTPEQKTARAVSAFVGFAAAVVFGFGISRNVDVYTNWEPQGNRPGSQRGLISNLDRVGIQDRQTPCVFACILEVGGERLRVLEYVDRFDKYQRFQDRVCNGSIVLFVVILLFLFRIVQLAVRLVLTDDQAAADDPSPCD